MEKMLSSSANSRDLMPHNENVLSQGRKIGFSEKEYQSKVILLLENLKHA